MADTDSPSLRCMVGSPVSDTFTLAFVPEGQGSRHRPKD
jgi:hypothetical protein